MASKDPIDPMHHMKSMESMESKDYADSNGHYECHDLMAAHDSMESASSQGKTPDHHSSPSATN